MKKVFLVLGLLTIGVSSCKKDWTCECSVSSNGVSVTSSDLKYQIKNSTEDDATNECDKMSAYAEGTMKAQYPDGSLSGSCKLN
jgi:hypothetical protein